MGKGPPWWHGRFKGCGYKLTAPRDSILSILSKTAEHLSAEEVYLRVHKVYPAIGLTTIYRTLELLVRLGMVYKYDFGDGRSRYELAEGPNVEHHHHLVCNECGRIINYTDFIDEEVEFFKKIEKTLSKKYDFTIETHQLHFLGLCNECKSR